MTALPMSLSDGCLPDFVRRWLDRIAAFHLKHGADGHLLHNAAGHLVHTCANPCPNCTGGAAGTLVLSNTTYTSSAFSGSLDGVYDGGAFSFTGAPGDIQKCEWSYLIPGLTNTATGVPFNTQVRVQWTNNGFGTYNQITLIDPVLSAVGISAIGALGTSTSLRACAQSGTATGSPSASVDYDFI